MVDTGTHEAPLATHSWKQVAIQRQAARDYPAAIKALCYSVHEAPDDAEAWFRMGICCGHLGNHADAIKAFSECLRIGSLSSAARRQIAFHSRQTDDTARAITVLEEGWRQDPYDEALGLHLALLLSESNRCEEAIAICRTILQSNPNCAAAWKCLGCAYVKLAELDKAIKCFKRLLVLDRNDTNARRWLVECYRKQGDVSKTIDALREVTATAAADEHDWSALGVALFNELEFSGAAHALRQSLALNPEFSAGCYWLGRTYRELGFVVDAHACFRRALTLDNSNSSALAELQALNPRVAAMASTVARVSYQSPPYSEYVSPFQLLNSTNRSLTDWDDTLLRRHKKRLLAEVRLNDGKVAWLSDIELIVEMSESRDVTVTAYATATNQAFGQTFCPRQREVRVETLVSQVALLHEKIERERVEAEKAENYEVVGQLRKIESAAEELGNQITLVSLDDTTDDRYKLENRKRELAHNLDTLTKGKTLDRLRAEYKEIKQTCEAIVAEHGNDAERQMLMHVAEQERAFLSSNNPPKIQQQVDTLRAMQFTILRRMPPFLIETFSGLAEHRHRFNDLRQAKSLIDAGKMAIANEIRAREP